MNLLRLFARFFSGSAAGAVLDLLMGTLLLSLGFSLLVSCAVGLACAVALTYWIHLRWTFSLHGTPFFSLHLFKFCASSLLTLSIRLLMLEIGQTFLSSAARWKDILLLILAVGVSFAVNFLLSALWAFRYRP